MEIHVEVKLDERVPARPRNVSLILFVESPPRHIFVYLT